MHSLSSAPPVYIQRKCICILYLLTPGLFSHPNTPGLLRTNGDMEAHVVAMGVTGDQREAPLVQAEVLIQVCSLT